MGWLDRMKGSYEAGKIQQRHAEERAYRKKLAEQQKSRQEAMNKPNKTAAFAGRVVESPIGKFGRKAAAATETAGKAGLNWVMTGNTEGVQRKTPTATTPRKKRSSSKSTSTRVVYVAASPPKPKRRKPKKNYWDNPPF